MKKNIMLVTILASFLFVGCSHNMRITNINDYFVPPSSPVKQPIKLGVVSNSMSDPQNGQYVSAIVDALQKNSSIEKVLYPYNQAAHGGIVDVVVDIAIQPSYSGSGSNFFVNWPGFLIFAPAIWGYEYNADIETLASITSQKDGRSQQITIPTIYHFRHAAMNRTWTEVGWLEVGVIPLIGGAVFTSYDTNVTSEFIRNVSPNYGTFVAKKIVDAACDCLNNH